LLGRLLVTRRVVAAGGHTGMLTARRTRLQRRFTL
jgi:hypothetical protein